MITAGVGLGVAMLLAGATIPALAAARETRLAARAENPAPGLPRAADTVLLATADSGFRGHPVHGVLVQPEGPTPALPPGVPRLPGPGELVVSPALGDLLASADGAPLRERWGAAVIGEIGRDGLAGPAELAFYLGTDRLTEHTAVRVNAYGHPGPGAAPVLLLLAVAGLAALLVPVAVFVTTAVRLGGETRDRRLAALRLAGADPAMTRRIAAGETLAAALLGLPAGAALCGPVVLAAHRLVPAEMSFYLSDARPVPALVLLVIVAVPLGAVLVTLAALRRVVAEPLGVVRQTVPRRRLWWRLILPLGGLILLEPLYDGLGPDDGGFAIRVTGGLLALLVGVALLLPWLVEATVRRLRGGGPAGLQLGSGTAVRSISGIAVSVAGVIALQGLATAVQAGYTDRFQVRVWPTDAASGPSWVAALSAAPGVTAADTGTVVWASAPSGTGEAMVRVGSCDVLRQYARLGTCTDGDTFVGAGGPAAGTVLHLGGAPWTVPAGTRTATGADGVLTTPAALGTRAPAPSGLDVYVGLDPGVPDAVDRLRGVVAATDPGARLTLVESRPAEPAPIGIRQALPVGAAILLLLAGAGLLVNVAERLHERRRAPAVPAATVPVLCQVAAPVLLGLGPALLTGGALAAILQLAAGAPVRLDWPGIAVTGGAAAVVVLATTAASLPLRWRPAASTTTIAHTGGQDPAGPGDLRGVRRRAGVPPGWRSC